MLYIVLYVYGIYSIHLLQTMSLKSGRVAVVGVSAGQLIKAQYNAAESFY